MNHRYPMMIVASVALVGLLALAACRDAPPQRVEEGATHSAPPVVLFIGDSLTFGYGLAPSEAYPALIQEKIREAGLPHVVRNAGVSGATTADGLGQLAWHEGDAPAVLVLALGANDGLRGVDPDVSKANLKAVIDRANALPTPPRILLIGMKAPPNMGLAYTRRFERMFTALAADTGVAFLPFLLEGVAADPRYNLADGMHPNAAGHQIMAEAVWARLRPLISPR